jgi:hypothetical protein
MSDLSDEEIRARQQRAREIAAWLRADERFMRELAEGIERSKRGEGTPWTELKRKRDEADEAPAS